MIGPPSSPDRDGLMMGDFFGSKGKHIVCGGTTAHLAASYLGKPLEVVLDYQSSTIPPIGRIEGVELVTEGVVTIGLALEAAKRYLSYGCDDFRDTAKTDGVSALCRLLFDAEEPINFYIGTAVNDAHQAPKLEIDFNHKMEVINGLRDALGKMRKEVTAKFY
jgi:protein serine/threonine phosphatase